jgi:hypothetical protein
MAGASRRTPVSMPESVSRELGIASVAQFVLSLAQITWPAEFRIVR